MTDISNQTEGTPVGERIVRAGIAVFIAHACFKLLGFVQFFVVGGVAATPTWETVYGFAFTGVVFSVFLIGEELIGPALLPVFTGVKERQSEGAAWRVANTLWTFQLLILLAAVAALMLVPQLLTRWLTYWDPVHDHEYFDLAVGGLRWMAPALLGFSLGSTTYMLLNGYKKFFLAAFGDAVWKAGVLLAVGLGMGWLGFSWRALALGVVAGSLGKLVTHLVGLRGKLRMFRPCIDAKNPEFRAMLRLMAPLLLGIVFAKVRDFYNHITVLSSLEAGGLIKANAYGRKLFEAISMMVPYTLSIAMFPFFCDLVARNSQEHLGEILTKSGRMLLVVFLPVAMVFVVYSHVLVQLLVIGEFSAADARLAGVSMACYTLVLPAAGLEMMLMQAFFAHRRMWLVTGIGMLFSLLSIMISYVGIIHFHAAGARALLVVALGFVISRTLKALALTAFLKQSVPLFPARETGWFLFRLTLVGAVATAAVYGLFHGWDAILGTPDDKIALAGKLVAGIIAAAGGYLLSVWIMRIREPLEMLQWAWARARGGRKRER
jgi:peptidoglycan biosynthesis protein MviN/MurJ (putative lipid II flippase)